VVGDAIGKTGVRAGGEIELAAFAALGHEVFEQGAVVGQVLDIEGDAGGDFTLEIGFAAKCPQRGFEGVEGASTDEQQQRVDQSVGLDESAVKVHAEGTFECEGCCSRHAAPENVC